MAFEVDGNEEAAFIHAVMTAKYGAAGTSLDRIHDVLNMYYDVRIHWAMDPTDEESYQYYEEKSGETRAFLVDLWTAQFDFLVSKGIIAQ